MAYLEIQNLITNITESQVPTYTFKILKANPKDEKKKWSKLIEVMGAYNGKKSNIGKEHMHGYLLWMKVLQHSFKQKKWNKNNLYL